MKIYFEDGPLTKDMNKLPPNLKHSIDASYGVTNNIRVLEDIKKHEPVDTVVYTNDISALNNIYAWNNKLNCPNIYFRSCIDNEFHHINRIMGKVYKDDDIAKLYVAGVTGELFSINEEENDVMYLIKKVTFDSSEDHLSKAICEETIGILDCENEETVTKWVEDHKPGSQYRGWDGKKYPYYTKTPISVLRLDDEPVEKKPNDIKSMKEILEEANRYEDIKTILTKIITEDNISSTYRVDPFVDRPSGVTKWSVDRDDVQEETHNLLENIDNGVVYGECERGVFRNLERYIKYTSSIKLRCYAVAEANNNHTPGDTTIDDIRIWLILDNLLFGLNRPNYAYNSRWKIPEEYWKRIDS